jgi:hypothetical protein
MKFINFLFCLTLLTIAVSINKEQMTDDLLLYHSPEISDFNHLPHSSIDTDVFEEENEKTEEIFIKENNEQNSKIKNIQGASSIFTLDKKKGSCDIQVKEKISFVFPQKTNTVDHIIISKKTPLYGFVVESLAPGIIVKTVELYQDTSYKQRIFIDDEERRLAFRDRWLVTVALNTSVTQVDLEFSYYMQRAVLIDPINSYNYLNFNVINPYPEDINYKVQIKLLNFEDLDPDSLSVPNDTMVKVYPGGYEIESNTLFYGHSEYDLNLVLPMELETCEKGLVNIVYYSLIVMSSIFVFLSVITLFYISKE